MRLAVLALLAVAAASTGCKKSVVPGCRTLCTCTPCTDGDLDACVDQASSAQQSAADKGCTDAFDAFVDCFEDTFSCKTHEDDCSRAEAALKTCAGEGDPFADICQRAADKTNTCFPGAMQPPTEPCAGSTACVAACTVAASCDELTGKAPSDAFNQCISQCSGPTPVP